MCFYLSKNTVPSVYPNKKKDRTVSSVANDIKVKTTDAEL